jgi:hypothetical protein
VLVREIKMTNKPDSSVIGLCDQLNIILEHIYGTSVELSNLMISNCQMGNGSRGTGSPPSLIRRLEFMINLCQESNNNLNTVLNSVKGEENAP